MYVYSFGPIYIPRGGCANLIIASRVALSKRIASRYLCMYVCVTCFRNARALRACTCASLFRVRANAYTASGRLSDDRIVAGGYRWPSILELLEHTNAWIVTTYTILSQLQTSVHFQCLQLSISSVLRDCCARWRCGEEAELLLLELRLLLNLQVLLSPNLQVMVRRLRRLVRRLLRY